MSGPLEGYRVVELAGLGPAPFAAMILADFGADVVRVDRAGGATPAGAGDVVYRGRRSIAVDLKHPRGRDVVLDLVERADALIEPFRPGVAERLGIGPDACLARNPALVYGRMTGFGQDGPLAERAGHDIDYIALAGALWRSVRMASPRDRRSTSSATSAAEGCSLPSGCWPRCSRRRARGVGRSSTRPWSTAPVS